MNWIRFMIFNQSTERIVILWLFAGLGLTYLFLIGRPVMGVYVGLVAVTGFITGRRYEADDIALKHGVGWNYSLRDGRRARFIGNRVVAVEGEDEET